MTYLFPITVSLGAIICFASTVLCFASESHWLKLRRMRAAAQRKLDDHMRISSASPAVHARTGLN